MIICILYRNFIQCSSDICPHKEDKYKWHHNSIPKHNFYYISHYHLHFYHSKHKVFMWDFRSKKQGIISNMKNYLHKKKTLVCSSNNLYYLFHIANNYPPMFDLQKNKKTQLAIYSQNLINVIHYIYINLLTNRCKLIQG